MKSIKCPNCGANVNYDESNNIGTCQYCNSKVFMDEKDTIKDKTVNNGNYDSQVEPRPVVNMTIFILLLIFSSGFFGIVYLIYIKAKQDEWDKKYR